MLFRLLKDIFGGATMRSRDDGGALAAAHYQRGMAELEAGRPQEALPDLQRAAALAPEDPTYEAAVDRVQAYLRFPGEHYFEILRRILQEVRPRTYLEIGVAQGDSLRLVEAPTIAIGVDPEPKISATLAPNQRVFAETSDAFFATRDLRAELGGLPIDLAFIDGMHHFEFALRDFANVERHCAAQSTILIHDCYPLDRITAERERHRNFWSGDVWRLIVLLKEVRPDLSIHTIATAPTGLAMVRNLDPRSRVLLERHDALCRQFLARDYSWLEDDMAGKLNLFPNDWAKVRALLG